MGEGASEASFLYLDTVVGVERFTSEISAMREIALDTEGASFHRFVDRIYLLQLSTRQHHAVIDPLPIGVWVHLVGTWDGEGMGLYIDGALIGIAPAPLVAFDAQPVLFGCDDDHDQAGPNGLLAGAMDDVRIYARALDAEDIAALADQRSP